MLNIHSVLRGFYGFVKSISKRCYRNCAIVMAGTMILTMISFNSNDFGGSGKNKMTASRHSTVPVKTLEDEDEESDTEAKLHAMEEAVSLSMRENDVFVKEKNPEAAKEKVNTVFEKAALVLQKAVPDQKINLSDEDYRTLLRIVEAEATGETREGKMLVANVILNRMNHPNFPNSVKEVVFQKTGGHVQFSPTIDGRYESVTVTDETIAAVEGVLYGADASEGALFFSARSKADPTNMSWFDNNLKWLFAHGEHEFYTLKTE